MNSPSLAFDPECALPNTAYRDQAFLAAEMAGIWRGDWVFVTTEDAVAAPGDQLPVVIGDQPVLLLRSQDGELVALSNLCAHRGTLLVERPANAKRIQCPYHAWTYRDDGRLVAVPFAPKDAIDKAAHCLPVYRVESWHGLIFVSLDSDVEPLTERFAAVEPHVAARGIDEMHHRSDHQEAHVWDCNWKLAILNAMESYHLFQVHPRTLEPYTPTKDAYYITGSARATATGGRSKGQDDYLLVNRRFRARPTRSHGTGRRRLRPLPQLATQQRRAARRPHGDEPMIPTRNDSRRAGAVRLWPTWVAVTALWSLTLTNQTWVYALLFLAWGVYDLATGESSFIQSVTRRQHPVTYWLVVSTWIVLAALWIAYPE